MKTINVFSKGKFVLTLFAHHEGDEKSFKHDWNNCLEIMTIRPNWTVDDVQIEMQRYGWQILVPPADKVEY